MCTHCNQFGDEADHIVKATMELFNSKISVFNPKTIEGWKALKKQWDENDEQYWDLGIEDNTTPLSDNHKEV